MCINYYPRLNPSAQPGQIPQASTIEIEGTNTNQLAPDAEVLTYGNEYQAGYIFAIDDTTNTNESIEGKVAALENQVPPYPNGTTWDPNPVCIYQGICANVSTSTTNGAQNTTTIVGTFTPPYALSSYAAGVCEAYNAGNYANWYLPAICEMGYDTNAGTDSTCQNAVPILQNMQTNLVYNGNIGGLAGLFWSSTQSDTVTSGTNGYAFYQVFGCQSASCQQSPDWKGLYLGVRCARTMTQ